MIEILGIIDKPIEEELIKVFNYIKQLFNLPNNIKINLNFVSQAKIKQLNNSTRGINKITDVLTYPYVNLKVGESLNLKDYNLDIDPLDNLLTIGDIYICTTKAEQQALEFGHSLKREICFLFCHGFLHILGYDHILPNDEKLMIDQQNKILNNLNITRQKFKCGFVTIVGETNAGKSTLINQLVGMHVAIVSPKSQTTRENILGIFNDENTQIVFVDTPGYHKNVTKVDEEMEKNINIASQDTEIVLMLISAKKNLKIQYEEMLKKVKANAKKILVINKIDESSYEKLYPQLAQLDATKVEDIIPISALKGTNCNKLLEVIKNYLPQFDKEFRYFPIEEYTNKTVRNMVAELIREKALLLLNDEVPHGIQVVVEGYEEDKEPINIFANVYCEKESHKAIILGKNGAMIKEISTRARKAIENFVNKKVNLQLFVKVKPNWRNNLKDITEFGLNAEI